MARPKKGEITKADVIRQGLKDHPDLGPKDLAEKLNDKVKKDGLKLPEIKPGEISVYKSKEKESGVSKAATKSSGKAPVARRETPAGQVSVANVLQTARSLVTQLGKEEAKKVIDLL